MTSKATTILMRLREIDKKYKNRYEDKSNTSDSDNDDNNGGIKYNTVVIKKSDSETKPLELYRPQLNIKIPDAYQEYLDTNSANDDSNNEYLIGVRVIDVNDCVKTPNTSSKISITSEKNKNVVELVNKIVDSAQEKINDKLNELLSNERAYNGELSISENIDDVSETLYELSENFETISDKHSNFKIISGSDKTIDEETNSIINIGSEVSSTEKYSDDSFESNSSEENKSEVNLIPPSLAASSSSSSLSSKSLYENVGIDTKIISAIDQIENSTDISNRYETKIIVSSKNYKQLSADHVNEVTHKMEQIKVQQSNKQMSIDANNLLIDEESKNLTKIACSHADNDIAGNNSVLKIKHEHSTNPQNSQEHSLISDKTLLITKNNLIKSTMKNEVALENSGSKIDSTRYANEKLKRNRRRKKNIEHCKGEFSINRKILEQNMRRDHIYFRREHEQIHSTMIHYLKEMNEERRKLHQLWPKRLTCPERVDVGKTIKPLDFPNVSRFIRPPDDLINQNANPNINILRNRLLDIRQWMKDQYSIYVEHCNVAASINKTYCENLTVKPKKMGE